MCFLCVFAVTYDTWRNTDQHSIYREHIAWVAWALSITAIKKSYKIVACPRDHWCAHHHQQAERGLRPSSNFQLNSPQVLDVLRVTTHSFERKLPWPLALAPRMALLTLSDAIAAIPRAGSRLMQLGPKQRAGENSTSCTQKNQTIGNWSNGMDFNTFNSPWPW